jgi:formate C-acetyltransferase
MADIKPQSGFFSRIVKTIIPINTQTHLLLKYIANKINKTPEVRKQLKTYHGWLNFIISFRSEDDKVKQSVIFKDGFISIEHGLHPEANMRVIFVVEEDAINQLTLSPDEATRMILRGRTHTEGDFFYMGVFDYLISLVLRGRQVKELKKQIQKHQKMNLEVGKGANNSGRMERKQRSLNRLSGKVEDPGVKYLWDPYFSEWCLDDFPRVHTFRGDYIQSTPQLSAEYGKLITDFFLKHGFEKKTDGTAWDPNLRHAESFVYVMKNKKAVIRPNDLLAGSYTEYPISSHIGHPHSVGMYIWGELISGAQRENTRFNTTPEDIHLYHNYILPYWMNKNILSIWRAKYPDNLPVKIQDRFFAIFYWKVVSMMEISPGYEKLIQNGIVGLEQQIQLEIAANIDPTSKKPKDLEKHFTLQGMLLVLDAAQTYILHLAEQAHLESENSQDSTRKKELNSLEQVLRTISKQPPKTVYEAVQLILIFHIMIGTEQTDDGPSMGRLDQLLQPFFIHEISQLSTLEQRKAYVKDTIELIGCLFLRLSSHQIVAPDIASWQNSGSAPNTVIVVGGVDRNGEDAVNDMTYLILKVIEMLSINDPNTHARYKTGKNSRAYLKRVCDVNFITGATPAIHGDDAVHEALLSHEGWEIEDIRGWTPTGCVEPSIPGKHASATSSLEVNLVAPLEMALNNGTHPLMRWNLGPNTGDIDANHFQTFDQVWDAFTQQVKFIVDMSVLGNNQLGLIYQEYLPSPLLSLLIDDCVKTGRGVTRGGAKYNSTGTAMIGLADVVDSLYTIKKGVFEDKAFTLIALKKAIDNNFQGYPQILAYVKNKIPKYGSRNPEALKMAKDVTEMVSSLYRNSKNYRGGFYTTGWWSMAHHASYGRVTGALPSGRLDGEPFTPGLTPHPGASDNLLDNLLDVSQLDPKTVDNNIAFNVRIVPAASDSHDAVVEHMTNYVQTFLDSKGMQVQFNVVDTDTLKDAMAHPELYPDLLVRVSGYCGYFTQLHRELQLEIIRRCEYGL